MVTKKPKGLGLGLEALLGPKVSDAPAAERTGEPSVLKLDQLQPGKYQPRTRMDEGSLYELAESIKSQGVMQPILVRPVGEGRYEIIAGERRSRAAKLAGLAEVPVLVKPVPDEAAAVMALIENIQREDLNPLEEAQGLQRLIDEFHLTHEQAAQAVGRSRSAASNLLRLLNLAPPVQQMLVAGDLDMGHARALLALDNAQQILSANEIVAKKLSVREAEKLVARAGASAGRQSPLLRVKKDKSRDIARLEEALADTLTAAVEIRVQKKTARGEQGEIAIRFGSLDELNGLLDKLGVREG
jgi:ParB family chromosome partitioning protein